MAAAGRTGLNGWARPCLAGHIDRARPHSPHVQCGACYRGYWDVEVSAVVTTLPGNNNQFRLLARIQQAGTAGYDGYMLRTNQTSGTDQVFLERIDNGSIVGLLVMSKELAVGDALVLRVKGATLEAWHRRGTTWTKLGAASDSRYSADGRVGVGIRGKAGRLDNFGAR